MAEFQEVMRQAKRLCEARDGENPCDECPITDYCMGKLYVIGKDAVPIEEYVTKWAKEHPEPQYPTWYEWIQKEFPNGTASYICPRIFDKNTPARCNLKCDDCYRSPIPAEIAEKLGVKPKGGERK